MLKGAIPRADTSPSLKGDLMQRKIISMLVLIFFVSVAPVWAAPSQDQDNRDSKTKTSETKTAAKSVPSATVVPASKDAKSLSGAKNENYPSDFEQNKKVHKNFESANRSVANNLKTEMDKVSNHLPQIYQTSAKTNKSAALVGSRTSADAGSAGTTDKETK
jgi:uncharacterized membrane protein